MTSPGRYAASDGSFAKSAGSAAARGGILIGIAVVIGFALLAWGFDGGDSDAAVGDDGTVDDGSADDGTADDGAADDGAADDGTADDGAADDGTADDGAADDGTADDGAADDGTADDATAGDVVVDDPSTIRVAVLNGTDTGGLAGQRTATLTALNYLAQAGNAVGRPDIVESKVYFVTGYADEAKIVAEAYSAPASVLDNAPEDLAALEDGTQADTANANIIVVIGSDEAIK